MIFLFDFLFSPSFVCFFNFSKVRETPPSSGGDVHREVFSKEFSTTTGCRLKRRTGRRYLEKHTHPEALKFPQIKEEVMKGPTSNAFSNKHGTIDVQSHECGGSESKAFSPAID